MANEMIEKVAEAIHMYRPNRVSKWNDCVESYKKELRLQAKAAIAATREPLKEIIDKDFEVDYPLELAPAMIKGRKDFRKNLIKTSIDELGEEDV